MHVDHLHREIFHAECSEFRPLCDKKVLLFCVFFFFFLNIPGNGIDEKFDVSVALNASR